MSRQFSSFGRSRDCERAIGLAHHDRGPEATYVGIVEEKPTGQLLVIIHAGGQHHENEVAFAGDVIGLLNLSFPAGLAPERVNLVGAFAFEFHRHDERHRQPDGRGVNLDDLSGDHLGVAQPPETSLHGGGGEIDLCGERLQRLARIVLHKVQEKAVDMVEFDHDAKLFRQVERSRNINNVKGLAAIALRRLLIGFQPKQDQLQAPMTLLRNPHRMQGLPGRPGLAKGTVQSDPAEPQRLLAHCPAARATVLRDLPELARCCGLGSVLVKDERERMEIGSFKALGAAYAIARLAAERAGGPQALARDPQRSRYSRAGSLPAPAPAITGFR